MPTGFNVSELLELAIRRGAVGAISVFLAGVFGIGGGAILVPVFYECFRLAGVPLEVRMPLCIGTSLAIIIPTSISSWRAHYRQRPPALAAGAAFQDRFRRRGLVGRRPPVAGARDLEVRRRSPRRPADES